MKMSHFNVLVVLHRMRRLFFGFILPRLCPQCKKPQEASKKFDIWSLPPILVVSLKRFTYNRFWRDKLNTFIEFPTQNLDMTSYVIDSNHGPAVYDLIAVSNHSGQMGSGHCKLENWCQFYFKHLGHYLVRIASLD